MHSNTMTPKLLLKSDSDPNFALKKVQVKSMNLLNNSEIDTQKDYDANELVKIIDD